MLLALHRRFRVLHSLTRPAAQPRLPPWNSSRPTYPNSESPASPIVWPLGFDHGLEGWSIQEIGGVAPGAGTVRAGSAILREGNSFLVSASNTFVVPVDPDRLQFTYSDLDFDTTDPDSMNDAFEVALLDSDSQSLVYGYATGREYINFTEEEPVELAHGVAHVGGTVSVDISGLHPGTDATVVFRRPG